MSELPSSHESNAGSDILTALTANKVDFLSVLAQYHKAKGLSSVQPHLLNQTEDRKRQLILETTAQGRLGKVNVMVKERGRVILGIDRTFAGDREICVITLNGGKVLYGMKGAISPSPDFDDDRFPQRIDFEAARRNIANRLVAYAGMEASAFKETSLEVIEELQRAALPTSEEPEKAGVKSKSKPAKQPKLKDVKGLAIGDNAQGPNVINESTPPGAIEIENLTGGAIGDNARVDTGKRNVSVSGDLRGKVIDLGRGNVISGGDRDEEDKLRGERLKFNISFGSEEGQNTIVTGNRNQPPETPPIPQEILDQYPNARMIKTRGSRSVRIRTMGQDRFNLKSTAINGVVFDGTYIKVGSSGEYDIYVAESEIKK